MNNLSVVIITKNAALRLKEVIEKAKQISSDIIVVDSYSEDATKSIAESLGARFYEQRWLGYGKQKNLGNDKASNNWILSLDADEILSEELIKELKDTSLSEHLVYSIPFTNYYCGKKISFGRWRNEKHVRIFNKNYVRWDENKVHESLYFPTEQIIELNHPILHFSMNSKEEHLAKAEQYSTMGALRLKKKGKKATLLKRFINPIYRFVMDYFLKLGFLDGKLGFQIALIVAKETFWKYKKLNELS